MNQIITDYLVHAIFSMHAEEENSREMIDSSCTPGIILDIVLSF